MNNYYAYMNIRKFLGTIFQFSQTNIVFIVSGIVTDEFEGTRATVEPQIQPQIQQLARSRHWSND